MQITTSLSNKSDIILFFGGFSAHPSHFTPFITQDFILLYHYTHLDFSALNATLKSLPKDSKITLIAFSLGVFVAQIFLSQTNTNFVRKIAINGTEYGIHPQYGIHPKLFKLTHKTFNLENFKQNLFAQSLEKSLDFTFRDSALLRDELGFFTESCAKYPTLENHKWNLAVISKQDLVFSPKAQKDFWQTKEVEILELDAPHFVFFTWNLKC